ncbi:MAG: hypothetical protein AB1478_04120 [Nitrospirota bacterium]
MTKKTYPRFRRRNFFIKKRFQANFILRFIFVLFIASLVYGSTLYRILDKRFEEGLYSPHLRLESTVEILGPTLIYVNLSVFLVLILISVVVILFISRRILDPLNRLKIDAARVEKGNLLIEESPKSGHLGVKSGEAFIKAIKDIREKIIRLKDSADALEIMTGKLKLLTELKELPREKVKEITLDIESKKNEFNKVLSEFKIE